MQFAPRDPVDSIMWTFGCPRNLRTEPHRSQSSRRSISQQTEGELVIRAWANKNVEQLTPSVPLTHFAASTSTSTVLDGRGVSIVARMALARFRQSFASS